MSVVRRTTCLVVGQVAIGGFVALFGCAPAGQASGLVMAPFQLSRLGLDNLSLVGPTGVQLLHFCCSSVPVLVLLLSTLLVASGC